MSQDTWTADALVAAYIKIRNTIAEREDAHKAAIEQLKGEQETITTALLNLCGEQNMDSIRTPAGTVSRRVQTRYWTTDWDSMYQFIKEHDAPYLLEQRIHASNMKQFLEENPDNLPIGLQADRKYVLHVRKPTGK